jgi:hypothetical protein
MLETIKSIILDFQEINLETGVLHRLQIETVRGKAAVRKGETKIRLRNGRVVRAELHWYEGHGIGQKEFKRKRYLD